MDDDELVVAGHMAEDIFVRQMKRLRGARGLSQSELADRVARLGGNLYQQTIAKIEAGQRAVRLQEADLIAHALGSSVSEMLNAGVAEGESDPESDPETMNIEDLLTRVIATQRRRDALAGELQEARSVEQNARRKLQVAQATADAYLAQLRRVQLHHDEIEAELRFLTRISLQRQSELNRKYGPHWRDKMRARPPLTVDEITGGRGQPEPSEGEAEKE